MIEIIIIMMMIVMLVMKVGHSAKEDSGASFSFNKRGNPRGLNAITTTTSSSRHQNWHCEVDYKREDFTLGMDMIHIWWKTKWTHSLSWDWIGEIDLIGKKDEFVEFLGDHSNHLLLLPAWETETGLAWGAQEASGWKGGSWGGGEVEEGEEGGGGGGGERPLGRLRDRQERRLLPRADCERALKLEGKDKRA